MLRLDQTSLVRDGGISVVTLRRLEDRRSLSKVAPTTVEVVKRALEKAGAEFIDRGVRRSVPAPATIQSIKDDIDKIVARGTAILAKYPPMTDDELYDENGI